MDNEYQPPVEVRVCYTESALHLQYRVTEQQPLIEYYKVNEPVCEDSCVEFFVQPTPETDERYLNFEFNAADTLFLGLGKDRFDRTRSTFSPNNFFQIQTNKKSSRTNQIYWELSFRVPFSWMQQQFPDLRVQSRVRMKANFYKCGDQTTYPHYGCWNKVTSPTPDFHRSCDFGNLVFG